MDANPFDLAAEFCKLVGVPNLLDYLGTSAQAAPAEVAEKLRARRRFVQGMQANPKFKSEAVFLIKNYNGLTEALADPRVYAEDVYRRSESGGLATLEAAVRGVMAGAPRLTPEQEVYLRNHARDLRLSERSYERLLRRIAHETGASLPLPPPTPSLVPQATMPHPRVASLQPVETPIAPPDRRDTAPPVIRRGGGATGTEGLPARLEVMGDPAHHVRRDVTRTVHIPVRNRGSGPMPGTVRVDAHWLVPLQAALDPDAPRQTVEVRVVPGLVGDDSMGRIEIHAGPAGSAIIEVHLLAAGSRVLRWGALAAGGLLALGVGALVVGLLSGSPSSLVIAVDPGGTVALDGAVVGTGTTVRIDNPRPGPVEILVEGGRNFAPWKQAI
ncbi:MAG: hypothetical protein H0V89_04675, partial [Deltaproteobacteria bacterium]|nr:hypothetical protein [Deltaproteobacteria bacterium]